MTLHIVLESLYTLKVWVSIHFEIRRLENQISGD